MQITIIQMSYLVAGKFAELSVKSDGIAYDLFMGGIFVDSFKSAQAAITYGMELIENYNEDEMEA